MEFTPIFVVTYGPIKLIINFTIERFWKILMAQAIYVFLLMILILFVYNKGVKKLNVNGG